MKKYLVTIILLLACFLGAGAKQFADETLNYTVTFKWGLFHKDAGKATLTLRNNGSSYNVKLTARSISWADTFYKLRDTLTAVIDKNGFRPKLYVRAAHEDGKYTRDEIRYSRAGNITTGSVTRIKTRKGNTNRITMSLKANGAAYDMLSVFYYLRLIDYASISKGKVVLANMFSGKELEQVKIKVKGQEEIKLRDKTKARAWHLVMNFTTAGKKKSSDDIDVWVSADARHIPLLVVGQLPVGQIKCYYTGKL